jgi:hypothetical protein
MKIKPPDTWGRVKALSWVYAEAAERGYVDYITYGDEILSIGEVEYDPRLVELESKHRIAGIQAIVFSAMCFEAAIYDHAAVRLGDQYVQDHLDKLDVLSKWIIVFRFITGYEIAKDRVSYSSLKQLMLARNRLVHSKSQNLNVDNLQEQFDKLNKESEKHEKDVHNAYRALVLMSIELEETLGVIENPLPSFNPKISFSHRERPLELASIISECRTIIERQLRTVRADYTTPKAKWLT